MTYFADLSPYEYDDDCIREGCVNVGWLDVNHGFRRAVPETETLVRLWAHCAYLVAPTRGIHDCEFCISDTVPTATFAGESRLLGTAEIRVFGDDGVSYAAPDLVFHYMIVHEYSPPREFLKALGAWELPLGEEYCASLEESSLHWRAATALSGPIDVIPPPDPGTREN